MHPPHLREQAVAWHAVGVPFREICDRLGVPRSTICHWLYGERARRYREGGDSRSKEGSRCPVCIGSPERVATAHYAYLLGMYLGDGHLVTSARVPVLRIYCTDTYVNIIEECERAMRATLAKSVQQVQKKGCVGVQAYSMHWPCLFPQHGPGKKHERNIVLADWQQRIVDAVPEPFLRGLFHSDGCRVVNQVTTGGRRYSYPRYFFSNESEDILKLCAAGLDRVGAEWRRNRTNSLSVARRDSVALLDSFIGPKD
ncbi:MAG: transcriptional regulator [Micromonosporaceae bacterium]|nr:transcriptional regulator [Micromonosporaceae bacterium]